MLMRRVVSRERLSRHSDRDCDCDCDDAAIGAYSVFDSADHAEEEQDEDEAPKKRKSANGAGKVCPHLLPPHP